MKILKFAKLARKNISKPSLWIKGESEIEMAKKGT